MKANFIKQYLGAGFALIPLEPEGKTPCWDLLPENKAGRKSWLPFAERAATAPEIQSWLEEYPDINLGIITGPPSGLIVVDIDRPDLVELGPSIEAPRVYTGKGLHVYFRADTEPARGQIKTAGGEMVGDIKAAGGYVVAPPSIHPTGRQYNFDDYFSLNNFDLPLYSQLQLDTSGAVHTRININTCMKQAERPKKGNDSTNSPSGPAYFITEADKKKPEWQRLTEDPEVARQVMGYAGIENARLGKAFICPFHPEDQPSAAIWKPEGGYIAYHDFHRKGGPEWYSLADIYKAAATGSELEKLTEGVGVVWWLRALNELGYIEDLPTIQAKKLPAPYNGRSYLYKGDNKKLGEVEFAVSAESVRKVYEGLKYLLQVRAIYDKKQRGTPFSWRFGAGWCGVDKNTAQKAMRYLMQAGLVYVRDERQDHQANILDIKRG